MKEVRVCELKKLGGNIRRLRKSRGMNQATLAQAAKTRPTTISAIENGINPNPGWALLGRVAKVLDSSIHELTLSDVSLVNITENENLSDGLKTLIQRQAELLALSEPRISLKELEWLAKTPNPEQRHIAPEEYLMILRHLRICIR